MAAEVYFGTENIAQTLRRGGAKNFLDAAVVHAEDFEVQSKVKGLRHPDFGFLQGHVFDNKVVVPGVTQLRMLEDAAGLAIAQDTDQLAFMTGLKNMRFRGVALDGDLLNARIVSMQREDSVTRATGGSVIAGDESLIAEVGEITMRGVDSTGFVGVPEKPIIVPDEDVNVVYTADQIDAAIMPQVYPFRFVDRVSLAEKYGVGWIRQDLGEDPKLDYSWVMVGGKKFVFPAYLIEAIAQVGTAVAMSKPENQGLAPLFGRIRSMAVYNMLEAGEEAQLHLEVKGYRNAKEGRGAAGQGTGLVVRADGLPIMETQISFATVEPHLLGQVEG